MISVIVPAYNAQKTIGQCLQSLLHQRYAGAYEVIVVDDGSTDGTAAACPEGVRVIRQNNTGPAGARNRGAEEAQGEIILFTDSDCDPMPDWIEEMVKPFQEHPEIVGVKGAYNTRQKEVVARFVQVEYEDKYWKMMKERYIDFIDTYSAAFRRDVFLDAKGYDLSFPVACAEDVELSYRLANQGCKMLFNPHAVVYHLHPDTLVSYLRKKYKFAYWRVMAVKKNPNKAVSDSHTPVTMKLQVVIFLAILAALPVTPWYPVLLSSSATLYFLTTLPFAFKAFRKDAVVGSLSPVLLFLRSAAQLTGLAFGVLRRT